MTFEDWYNEAKKIDDISDDEAVDISKTATSYLNKDLKIVSHMNKIFF